MTRELESQERWEKIRPSTYYDEIATFANAGIAAIPKVWLSVSDDERYVLPEPLVDHIVALHNARLAPQDAGGCYWDSELGLFCNKDTLTTRLREAERERDRAQDLNHRNIGRSAADYEKLSIEASEALTAAEARVTALEAALASQNYIRFADDRVPGSQETR